MGVAPSKLEPGRGSSAAHVRMVAERLQASVRRVVEQVPVATGRPQELARALKIHRTLVGRLLSALRTDDSLAAINRMPRSEGLHTFLDAARGSASKEAIAEAKAALSDFEALVYGDLGGWDALDAAISEWLPEVREKFELANKQLVFRGMCTLRGARADVHLVTSIYHPGASGEHCDIALITGLIGLRRLRPGVRIPVASVGPHPGAPQPLAFDLEDLPEAADGPPCPLLVDFCSKPLPEFEIAASAEMTDYVLAGDDIGAKSAADIITASIVRSARPLYRSRSAARQRVSASAGIEIPAKILLLNMLVDERVWPGAEPELLIFDTHLRGVASPNDPSRDGDCMDLSESIQFLGWGATRFRAAEVGRHVDMVQQVCERLGWDSTRLRGYRCRVQYPLIAAQYCMVFDPPSASNAAERGEPAWR